MGNRINWNQRRYEIAKEMLSAIYLDDGDEARAQKTPFEFKTLEQSAREAVRFADALIKELKKKKQND